MPITSSRGASSSSPVDASTINTTFSGIDSGNFTESADLTDAAIATDNPILRQIRLWVSSDPGADANFPCRLSFYNSDSKTEDELILDFFFNLTYTEVKVEWSATDTGGDVDTTAGVVKYDALRMIGGTAETVRITAVTDSDTLATTAVANVHAVNEGVCRVAELDGLFQLYDADGTAEIHCTFEALSAPNGATGTDVYMEIDVQ